VVLVLRRDIEIRYRIAANCATNALTNDACKNRTMTSTPLKSALWRNIGILIGYQGAMIGLALSLLGAGELGLLLEFVLPCAVIALALGLGAILMLELLMIARPGAHLLRIQLLWGILLTDMGLLLLIISEWVMPAVVESESFRGVMHRTHSVTTVPSWVVVVLISVGCVLLARTIRCVLATDQTEAPST
jgi:hypothetical protein